MKCIGKRNLSVWKRIWFYREELLLCWRYVIVLLRQKWSWIYLIIYTWGVLTNIWNDLTSQSDLFLSWEILIGSFGRIWSWVKSNPIVLCIMIDIFGSYLFIWRIILAYCYIGVSQIICIIIINFHSARRLASRAVNLVGVSDWHHGSSNVWVMSLECFFVEFLHMDNAAVVRACRGL